MYEVSVTSEYVVGGQRHECHFGKISAHVVGGSLGLIQDVAVTMRTKYIARHAIKIGFWDGFGSTWTLDSNSS